jgi:hypothetical protein
MTEYIWKSKIDNTEISTPRINLELFSDEEFDEFVAEIVKKKELDDAYLQADEERKKAEQVQLAEAQKQLQEEREKFEAEQDKVKKEMNDFKQQRATLRNNLLLNLGLGTMSFNTNWVYIPKNNIQLFVNIISYDDVLNYTNDEWDNKLAEIKVTIAKLKADDEVKSENLVEKVAFATDKEKYDDYIDRLKEQPVPEMTTKKWSNYVTSVTKSLNTFKNMS